MGNIASFGAVGDVKKPSHVERGSAVMPLLGQHVGEPSLRIAHRVSGWVCS
jgi:hypothetical protein